MSADVRYSVEVDFVSKGNLGRSLGLGGGAASTLGSAGEKASKRWDTAFAKTFGGMSDSISKLSSMFSMETAFGAMEKAATGAFSVIKFGLVNMNAEIESMKIGLGTMFTANGVTQDMSGGMQMASKMLTRMRSDAAVLPGEFKELAEIFQTILAPALNQGMSVERVREMATHAMAYGTSIGLRAPVIGREMAALLSHAARSQNILAQRLPGMALHGEAAKKFNALAPEDLVKKLETSIGMRGGAEGKAYNQALGEYSTAWVGVMSTLKDNFKLFAGTMTQDLFERLKTGLGWVNAWFSENKETVNSWAQSIGRGISTAFFIAFEYAKKLEPIFMRVGKFFQKEAAKGKLGRDVSIATMGIVGMQAGSMAAPAMMDITGGLVSAFAKISASQPEVALAAVVAVGAAMVPLAVFAMSAAGAFHVLSDNLSYYHDYSVGLMKGIEANLAGAMEKLKAIWAEIEEPMTNMADILGAGLLQGLIVATRALNYFLQGILEFVEGIRPWMHAFAPGIEDALYGHKPGSSKPFEFASKYREIDFGGDEGADRKITVQNHTTNIGKVEIKVISNQDPNRIAKSIFKIQSDFAKNPRITPNTQTQFIR